MRWALAVLLVLAAVCASRAETLSPSPFTSQFARALQAAVPQTMVTIARDLQLTVRRTDGSSVTSISITRTKATSPRRADSTNWFAPVPPR